MEILFSVLKALKGICTALKLLASFIRALRKNEEMAWLGGKFLLAAGILKHQMTPREQRVARVPKLGHVAHRFGETVLHYTLSTFFLSIGFFLLMFGRLQWEKKPIVGLLLLAAAMAPVMLGGLYARFGSCCRKALNREWAKHRKSWKSYAVMGGLAISLPLIAYAYEVAPRVLFVGM